MAKEFKEKAVKGWHDINWKEVNIKVSAIQDKIVKATIDKNIKTVYKLQRQLVVKFETRALAIRRVVTNSGSKTPGIDGKIWNTPRERYRAIDELGYITKNPYKYRASPVKRIYIPKPGTDGKRPLGIPTMMDRAVQMVYHMGVDPVVECSSDPNSYGFRKYRSAQDAITTLRNLLDKPTSPEWILETDVSKCFDKIDHEFLISNTPICDKIVLIQWLKSGIIVEGNYESTIVGTPQGGIISPLLCNVALNGIEKYVKKQVEPVKYARITGSRPKIYVIRYADDLVVTGVNEELLVNLKSHIEDFLIKRGLELKSSKTRIINIHNGFDFLGFNFKRFKNNPKLNKVSTKQKTILIIKPTSSNIKLLREKIKNLINKDRPLESIIRDLNPILRGWSEYYRISYHSKEIFITLGHQIWEKMWKWARKRHPRKTAQEITKMYLIPGKSHKWTWGKTKTETLFNLSEVTTWIKRPLKLDMNPYLIEHKEYLEKRCVSKDLAKFRAAIYKKYQHICIVCEQSLYNGEPVELHHITPVREGGKYTIENIQPLHRICHQKITHSK